MSERDLKRIEVLSEVLAGRRTVARGSGRSGDQRAAGIPALHGSTVRSRCGAELIHRARGQTSNRSVNAGIRQYAVELVKTRYANFGPTLATEMLLERHDLQIGRETLRRWMHLRFVPSESTSSYFEALESHGCPVAFYSDKHSVFRMNRDAAGGQGMTQFGRALAELNIEILCANSSQAKGRVERAKPYAAGPAGEGASACGDQQRGSRQRLFG